MTPSGEPSLENPPFFFGGELGTIYLADDFGLSADRFPRIERTAGSVRARSFAAASVEPRPDRDDSAGSLPPGGTFGAYRRLEVEWIPSSQGFDQGDRHPPFRAKVCLRNRQSFEELGASAFLSR